ncbi:hypothetical protein VTK26DRAFT_1663 [Humicola hyalothermophila]
MTLLQHCIQLIGSPPLFGCQAFSLAEQRVSELKATSPSHVELGGRRDPLFSSRPWRYLNGSLTRASRKARPVFAQQEQAVRSLSLKIYCMASDSSTLLIITGTMTRPFVC